MPIDRDRIIMLMDYYGDLLTKHQNDIMDEYFNEDLSMNEIADNYMISKSAVQDLIKTTISKLNEYEKKLHLLDKDKKIDKIIDEMKKENNDILNKYIDRINKVR